MSTALLLVQLGSPANLDVDDIETYLHQFLGDWHTIGKKSLFWKLLLKFVILPKGKFSSYDKYLQMFNSNDFKEMPLVTYSEEFLTALRGNSSHRTHWNSTRLKTTSQSVSPINTAVLHPLAKP